jgi:3-oxo-5-alpha-steroid 4-dehydrogenase 1
MFEYVSSANYFGEIVEWFGYAISTSTFQAWIFAIFTLSQLSARGLDHHRWYRKNFKNYPKERKAVVPFLY